MDEQVLLREARGYYPNARAQVRYVIFKKQGGGSYSLEALCSEIARRKIETIINYMVKQGVRVRSANTTNSKYFTYNGINFRISDHQVKIFEGINIVVRYDDDVVLTIFNKIILKAFKIS